MSKRSLIVALSAVGVGTAALAGSSQQIQAILGNVYLQSTTPGTVQAGHSAISGTFRAGQVYGTSSNAATIPIVGNNTATSGTSVGGSFSSASSGGVAVRGTATNNGGATKGVYGESRSGLGIGVYGNATGSAGTGVEGEGPVGVFGASTASQGIGGEFFTDGVNGTGVSGIAGSNGFAGGSFMYIGTSGAYGVYGYASGSTGANSGGYFKTNSTTGRAVSAVANAATGTSYAVLAQQMGTGGTGVLGQIPNAGNGYGILGTGGASGSGYAGYFAGRMTTTGTKMFQIDDPRNPENAYLNHYCSEGPEPLNEYRGNVLLDGKGEAWVKLPDYFDQINKDPSYTLTAIGVSMPGIYVARKVSDNKFKVAGGVAGREVSWRVTATRNDRFVRTYGAPVEQAKSPEQRGTYLQPELYGQPESKGQFFMNDQARK